MRFLTISPKHKAKNEPKTLSVGNNFRPIPDQSPPKKIFSRTHTYRRDTYSELFDIWGRGGFSRIAVAVKADPGNAITVDAASIEDISRMARIFCPFYDTVIVNWKGEIHPALGIVPMPDHLGPPGAFGGQGYIRTSDILRGKDGWRVAVGWGNFLPKKVSEFLATEALALLRSGRIVILPGPLVGCTQSAVVLLQPIIVLKKSVKTEI